MYLMAEIMERSDTISCNQGKCCTWHWHQYQRVSRESQGGGCCLSTGKSRYCRLGTLLYLLRTFAALFLHVHFSSEKCQSQNPCVPPSHSLVWQRNSIELETFCDTDSGHHFYCTQLSVVGSSISIVRAWNEGPERFWWEWATELQV